MRIGQRLFLFLLSLLIITGCSSDSGQNSGFNFNNNVNGNLLVRVDISSSNRPKQLVVEVVDPNSPVSPRGYSSFLLVVPAVVVDVPPFGNSVDVPVNNIPPGNWNIFAYGLNASGVKISSGGPLPVTINPFLTTDLTTRPLILIDTEPGPLGLRFSVQPSSTQAGSPITPAVTVEVIDGNNQRVLGATDPITLSLANAGGATLSGTLSVNAVDGVAVFPGLSVNKTGNNYNLVAASPILNSATSNGFAITPGAANRLSFSTQPTGGTVNTNVSPDVQVSVLDAQGNLVTGSTAAITIAKGSGTGSLSGTTVRNAVAGVATFTGLTLNQAGAYTLAASSSGLTGATSNSFQVAAQVATHLSFSTPPSNVSAGANINPAVVVQILDAGNNVVTGATDSITLAIGNNPGGATLSGGGPIQAVNGVATFPNLNLNRLGTGYTLQASAAGFGAPVASASFNVVGGAAAKLFFTVQPPASNGTNENITPSIQVEVQDVAGNRVTSANNAITMALGSNPTGFGVLGGTVTRNAVSGVATFDNLKISQTSQGYSLSASATGLTSTTSNGFLILPQRVSLGNNAQQLTGGIELGSGGSLSDNAKLFCFTTGQSLVATDTDVFLDVYVYNRETEVTNMVSVQNSGAEISDKDCDHGRISGDGSAVVFVSRTQQIPGKLDPNAQEVYVRDLGANSTEVASVTSSEARTGFGGSSASISRTGRYVIFFSNGNLVGDPTQLGPHPIYRRDRQAGLTVLGQPNAGNGLVVEDSIGISRDGNRSVFRYIGNDLLPGDNNGTVDAVVYDFDNGLVFAGSVKTGGVFYAGSAFGPSLSGDGRYCFWNDSANDIVPGDTNGANDVFRHDLVSNETVIVSTDSAGVIHGGGSAGASASSDGRFVHFSSTDNMLVPNDPDFSDESFVKDLQTGQILMTSTDGKLGIPDNGFTSNSGISADGQWVLINTRAHLLPSDTNSSDPDLYLAPNRLFQP